MEISPPVTQRSREEKGRNKKQMKTDELKKKVDKYGGGGGCRGSFRLSIHY